MAWILVARACLIIAAFCMFFLSVLSLLLLQHAETIEIPDTKKSKAGISCILCVALYAGIAYLSYAYIRDSKNSSGRNAVRRSRRTFADDGRGQGFLARGRRGAGEAWANMWDILQPGGVSTGRRRRSSWNEHLSDITNAEDLASTDFDESDVVHPRARGGTRGAAVLYNSIGPGRRGGRGGVGQDQLSTVIGRPGGTLGINRAVSNESGGSPQVELRPLIGQNPSNSMDRRAGGSTVEDGLGRTTTSFY
eukprot:GHVS01061051.1.p1 GENE.GHVS01061051.1~~GHVS01061051.1.p1  ORF type:complete len:250 (+),score=16.78 GHVS01061051.1:646-1395(+)